MKGFIILIGLVVLTACGGSKGGGSEGSSGGGGSPGGGTPPVGAPSPTGHGAQDTELPPVVPVPDDPAPPLEDEIPIDPETEEPEEPEEERAELPAPSPAEITDPVALAASLSGENAPASQEDFDDRLDRLETLLADDPQETWDQLSAILLSLGSVVDPDTAPSYLDEDRRTRILELKEAIVLRLTPDPLLVSRDDPTAHI